MKLRTLISLMTVGLLGTAFSMNAHAADRLVIQFKSNNSQLKASEASALVKNRLSTLEARHGFTMHKQKDYGDRGVVVELPQGTDTSAVLQRLKADSNVDFVVQDRPIKIKEVASMDSILASLSTSLKARSWNLQAISGQPASNNLFSLFANHHGQAPTVVAVLDSGVLFNHPMLKGHLLPGYDFVSDAFTGADGQSTALSNRDADPTDPGDYVTAADVAAHPELCQEASNSTWHGTFTASQITGNPQVAEGIFPMNWNAMVLPVRILGKCGGYSSDLADAIRWSAGLPVAGVPNNTTPARIINLSLGAQGPCFTELEGKAINEARAVGAIVVAAAGNDGSSVNFPANCPGVIAVSAMDQNGQKTNYGSYGPEVDLMAPGGSASRPIWAASNAGTQQATTSSYQARIGSSFSSPQVSAALAMANSIHPNLTADQLQNLLLSTTRPFLQNTAYPSCNTATEQTYCNCTTTTCGRGMLDVNALVRAASTAISPAFVNVYSNQGALIEPGATRDFTAQGSVTKLGFAATSATFSIKNIQTEPGVTTTPNVPLSTNGLQASVQVPAGAGIRAFNLQVSLGNDVISTTPIVVNTGNVPSNALALTQASLGVTPTTPGGGTGGGDTGGGGSVGENGAGSGSSGGGGGGAWPMSMLLVFGGMLAFLRRQSKGSSQV